MKNKDLIVSTNLLEAKSCSSLLIITSLGLVKKSQIELISSQLKLNKKDICGTIITVWIFIMKLIGLKTTKWQLF